MEKIIWCESSLQKITRYSFCTCVESTLYTPKHPVFIPWNEPLDESSSYTWIWNIQFLLKNEKEFIKHCNMIIVLRICIESVLTEQLYQLNGSRAHSYIELVNGIFRCQFPQKLKYECRRKNYSCNSWSEERAVVRLGVGCVA